MFNFFDENIGSKRKSLTIAMKQVMINLHILDKQKIFLFEMILLNIDILAWREYLRYLLFIRFHSWYKNNHKMIAYQLIDKYSAKQSIMTR
jgi:hypothetical protein